MRIIASPKFNTSKCTPIYADCFRRPKTAYENTATFRRLNQILESKYVSLKGKVRPHEKSVNYKNSDPRQETEKSKTLKKNKQESRMSYKENGILFNIQTILKSTKKTLNQSQCIRKQNNLVKSSQTQKFIPYKNLQNRQVISFSTTRSRPIVSISKDKPRIVKDRPKKKDEQQQKITIESWQTMEEEMNFSGLLKKGWNF